MTKTKKQHLYKLTGITLAAFISSLGAVPYGYEFGYTNGPANHPMSLLIGIVLAAAVCVANTALGAYSLLRMQGKQDVINPILLRSISFTSAVPFGCMCFFAYIDIAPLIITAFLTSAAYIVNAAVGYTAIYNFLLGMKKLHKLMNSYAGTACRMVGFIIGLAVSFTAYMAAMAGCADLLATMKHVHLSQDTIFLLSCSIGVITWIPFAFLFANAAQLAAYKIYHFFIDFGENIREIDAGTIAILILAICSGASYAQMTAVFFDAGMPIPGFLKYPLSQNLISGYLVPLAFIASAAVNYSALINLGGAASRKQVPAYT
jgi:hypothetical protein